MVRLLLVLAVVLVLLPAHAQAADPPIFFTVCAHSHTSQDDPIVFPGQPGAAHVHNFTGAWSTDAFSTYESLRRSGTTCDMLPDTAAYWSPVLYADGLPVELLQTFAYYVDGAASLGRERIVAHPPGLKVVADMSAGHGSGWHCGDGKLVEHGGTKSLTAVPACPEGEVAHRLQAKIMFPDCWDGVNLDSSDHRSHLTYTQRAPNGVRLGCPDTHPVQVPALNLKTVYNTYGNDGAYSVAGGHGMTATTSAPVSTFHADFFNAWDQAELERLVKRCINDEFRNGEPCRGTGHQTPNPNYPDPTPASPEQDYAPACEPTCDEQIAALTAERDEARDKLERIRAILGE